MVHDERRKVAMKMLKYRINHHEIHGEGDNAMKDKSSLKKLERHDKLVKEKRK